MSSQRPKRVNAGSRMNKLIEEADEEDDFYKTTYGGFNEEDNDTDYESEEPEEDIFDSDFSQSEEDDVESDDEEKVKKPQKRKIKTFKQPVLASNDTPKVKVAQKKYIPSVFPLDKQERMRATTILKGEQISKFHNVPMRRHPKQPQMRRLTQQELLAEAQITEEQNLASLAQFMQLEEDKKNAKITKVRYQGPIVRFQSVRMPLVSGDVDVDGNEGFCSRSFLEFTDTKSFPRNYFPIPKVRYPKKPVCVVTGLPAKYKDPLTGLPYATIDAFKYIRQYRKRIREQVLAKNELKKKKRKETSFT